MLKARVSVILPTSYEPSSSILKQAALNYPNKADIEYIVIDDSSDKSLLEHFKSKGFKIFTQNNTNRAEKLQYGLTKAKGDVILFHHPRSLLTKEAIEVLIDLDSDVKWGGL